MRRGRNPSQPVITSAERADRPRRFAGLRGEVRLRSAIDDLANQLCVAVDGNFDFAVRSAIEDETLEKLSMLTNFVLDRARRGMSALRQHNDALAQLDLAKTVFFSNASHELRTPLTLILGPLEDALSKSSPGLSGEALASAHRNAVRLLKLVNALLDFSRIEAGRLQATFQPTDLAALTTELAGVFRSAIERAGLKLTVDALPLPDPVYVDRQMWEQIVLNLLSNAFKFTFEGGIRVTLRAAGPQVELEVADSGVGIPPAEQPRIFDRFHRVEGTRARTHEGFGIGLAMIQELVRIHGGQVTVTSTVDQGSVFKVRLPRGNAHLAEERIGPARDPSLRNEPTPHVQEAEFWIAPAEGNLPQSAAPVNARGDTARILVADDNADMRDYVRRLLSEHWTVETVPDGAAALAAVRDNLPDLVVSDIMMPGLDGHQLVRELRADPRTASVPVIMLSARAGEEATVEGLEAGADDYIVKPFSGRELIARVRTHVHLARLRSDAATIDRIGNLLNARLELQDVGQILTDETVRLCGAQYGTFVYNAPDDAGGSDSQYEPAVAPREAFAGVPMPPGSANLSTMLNGERILRLDDVTQDARYGKNSPLTNMPLGHLPVRSYLAVPVVSRSGEVLGGLFLGHGEPAWFSERNEQLIGAVARHAAVAIDNAQLYKSAREARVEAEAATRAKDEFLAMLGHELRNPLAPIVTSLEIMNLTGDRVTQRERGVIQRQVNHVVRLVDDLMDVARITRGKIDLNIERLELSAAVKKAVEIANPCIQQRQHRLVVDVPPTGLLVRGDFVRLAQVVSNLLTNAAKFTEPGGTITVTGSLEGADVLLRVRDTGAGIAPENLQQIFEMFAQGPQSLARSQGGLGLGLAITRNLLKLHGGSIEARSEGPGRGSEFIVRLPFNAANDERRGSEASPLAAAVTPATASRRILVVDDNKDAAEMLGLMLTTIGHQIRIAHDGSSALKIAADFLPNIALLDIGLPGMNGYELARELRGMPATRGTRLVAVSGYGQTTDQARSYAFGFDMHLVKPVDLGKLQALVASQDP